MRLTQMWIKLCGKYKLKFAYYVMTHALIVFIFEIEHAVKFKGVQFFSKLSEMDTGLVTLMP